MDHIEALDLLDAQHKAGSVSENAYAVKRARLMAEAIRTDHDKRMSWLSAVLVVLISLGVLVLGVMLLLALT